MPQNAASDQGLHCLKIVQTFFFRNIYIIQPDIPKMDKRLFQNIVWESLFSLRVYSALNGLMLSAKSNWSVCKLFMCIVKAFLCVCVCVFFFRWIMKTYQIVWMSWLI